MNLGTGSIRSHRTSPFSALTASWRPPPQEASLSASLLHTTKNSIGVNILWSFQSTRAALVTFTTGAQLLISVNACLVAVLPDRRQAITANRLYVHQCRLFNAQALFVLQHPRLAAFACAPCTRTGPA